MFECNSKLTIKRLPFLDNLFLGCSCEIVVWIIVGVIASFYTYYQYSFVIVAVVLLIVLSFFLKNYHRLRCKSCKREYQIKSDQLVLITKNK